MQRVRNDTRARMLRMPDPRMRDRLHDIDDLSNRLLRLLSGGVGTAATGSLPQDAIVIARTMGPAASIAFWIKCPTTAPIRLSSPRTGMAAAEHTSRAACAG